MLTRILVPLDGSDFAEHALPVAYGIARRASASVRLLRVHIPAVPLAAVGDLSAPVYDPAWDEQLRRASLDYLTGLAVRGRRAGVDVSVEVTDNPSVADQITASAEAFNANLIVMTTHGHGGHSLAWFGSVADAVVRHTRRPTVVVPDRAQTDLFTMRRILVCTDGSRAAEATVDAAGALATVCGAEVALAQVVAPPPGVDYRAGGSDSISRVGVEGIVEAAKQTLEATADRIRARGRTVSANLLVSAQPARALLDHIAETRPDMIALGTHGRGLSRLFVGSVADKVMRGGTTPALVYRLPD